MKKFLLLTLAFLTFFVYSSNAQTDKISVSVSVTADDSIKGDIEGYVKRELRSLGDIDLYDTKPDYEIRLIAIKPGSAVAVSTLVLQKYDLTDYLNNVLSSKGIDEKTKKDLSFLAKKESVEQYSLNSDSIFNLSEICKSIVASIDAETFESERKLKRYINNLSTEKSTSAVKPPKQTNQTVTTQPKQNSQPVFERRYVGGNRPPQIAVTNDADVALTLNFGNSRFVIPAGQSQTINTTDGGVFSFVASAPGVESLSGEKNFERGYIYTWKFYVITVRR